MAVVLKGKPLLVYRDYWLLALNVVPCQRPVKRKQDSTMQCGHRAVQWTMSYILIISRFRVVHCGIFYGPLFFLGIVYTRAFGKIKTQNIPRLAYILHTFYHDYYHYEPSHLVYRYTGEFLLFSYPYMELWRSSLMFRSFVYRYTRIQPATDSHPLFVLQFEEAKKQLFKYLLSSLQNEMITMAMIMIM